MEIFYFGKCFHNDRYNYVSWPFSVDEDGRCFLYCRKNKYGEFGHETAKIFFYRHGFLQYGRPEKF